MTLEPPADARSWRLALLLLTLSGTAGLIYEVVWARQLILIFGATNSATTTVLTAFMLGLALGSPGASRWARRWGNPLRAYACFEFGIGVYGLAAWNDIGVTLAKQGQPGSALAAFERALGLLPDSASCELTQGDPPMASPHARLGREDVSHATLGDVTRSGGSRTRGVRAGRAANSSAPGR